MATADYWARHLLSSKQGLKKPLACPRWPPDAFAVAATVMEQSAAYARRRAEAWAGSARLDQVRADAGSWRTQLEVPRRVRQAWRRMLDPKVALEDAACNDAWCDDVYYVLACADEACEGIGFSQSPSPDKDIVTLIYEQLWMSDLTHAKSTNGTERGKSVCLEVSSSIACVQPKARTSQVGCTMRTLTHHLALLPAASTVRTQWFCSRRGDSFDAQNAWPLNLLVVPFPFKIDGSCFVRRSPIDDEGSRAHTIRSGYFGIEPRWLRGIRTDLPRFLSELVSSARDSVGSVNGLILPELALDSRTAMRVAAAMRSAEIEVLVSGVIGEKRNVLLASFDFGHARWMQSKHHRWCLNERQVRRYHLGHALQPHVRWWEDIDLGERGKSPKTHEGARAVNFVEARPGAIVCTLICEDLARHEPVHPIVRSIGPNLVIALLMDGPQLAKRWPGQYASVLADDPGSAVLTLTSLGMLRRSVLPGENPSRVIALWKDAAGDAKELMLPEGAHGLVLSCNARRVEELTLDGRSDGRTTLEITLGAVHAVAHPRPPTWAK